MNKRFCWKFTSDTACKFCRGCQKSTIRLERCSLSIQEMCYLCKRNWSAKWSFHSQFVTLCCTPVKQEIRSNIVMEHGQAFLLDWTKGPRMCWMFTGDTGKFCSKCQNSTICFNSRNVLSLQKELICKVVFSFSIWSSEKTKQRETF